MTSGVVTDINHFAVILSNAEYCIFLMRTIAIVGGFYTGSTDPVVSHPATSVSVVRKSASISVQLKIAYNSFSDINYKWMDHYNNDINDEYDDDDE